MKKALITGISGQDGSYLAELLLERGYEVHGLIRRSSREPFVRFSETARKAIKIHYGDIRDLGALERAVVASDPDEVYNFAAQSDFGVSFAVPEETYEINYAGVGRLVEAVTAHNAKTKVCQASSSEMFGSAPPPQNEETPFQPVSPYGEAKLRAHEEYVKEYRERKGLFICSAILFNHESPRRGEHFVTRKITISLAKIKLGSQESFQLGNLDARRDWGFAGDYVKAMHLMLQQSVPDDYVIATGSMHSVREFVLAAASALDMELHFEGRGESEVARDASGKVVISVSKEFFRPNEVYDMQGDASKARKKLGWKPDVSFEELVRMMAKADYERFQGAHTI